MAVVTGELCPRKSPRRLIIRFDDAQEDIAPTFCLSIELVFSVRGNCFQAEDSACFDFDCRVSYSQTNFRPPDQFYLLLHFPLDIHFCKFAQDTVLNCLFKNPTGQTGKSRFKSAIASMSFLPR